MYEGLTAFAGRLLPARPDLAAAHLRGRVEAAAYVRGLPRRVTASLPDLTATPDREAELATQLVHGESFVVYEERADGLAWGQAELDGYVGYVAASGLGTPQGKGRRVTALWSQIYPRPSLRSRTRTELPYLSEVAVSGTTGSFARLRGGGNVPVAHIAPVSADFVSEAERFLGAPYLWGGRSARGIDCSALVQLALIATGRAAPRDSDMQAAMLGRAFEPEAALRRGDLVFWRGHVGIMLDAARVLHANAYHMAVVAEPLAAACARIEDMGGGAVIGRRRLDAA